MTCLGCDFLTTATNAELIITDILGRMMRKYTSNIGNNTTTIKKSNLAAGIYFYTLNIDDTDIETKKMIIVN